MGTLSSGAIIGIVVGVIAAVIIALVIYIIVERNKFIQLKVKIEESESDIDVALTKRYDLLTKQMGIVKGYAKHEMETLTNVIGMRGGMSMADKSEANKAMDAISRQINILAEQYPQLKANENFRVLQVTTADVEEHLSASRRLYNSNVSIYNKLVLMFPSNLIAKMFHFEKTEFFVAEEAKRADVEMNF